MLRNRARCIIRYQSQFVDPAREKRYQERVDEFDSIISQRSKKYTWTTIPPKFGV